MQHLFWHKNDSQFCSQLKIKGLRDDHSSEPGCLVELSRLSGSVRHPEECKRLLIHALKLWREQGGDCGVAVTLAQLSEVNRLTHLPKQGIPQEKEALVIFERLGDTTKQAWLLHSDNQLDAAFRAMDFLPEKGGHRACESHQILSRVYQSKGENEKAIHHLEVSLGIASSFGWYDELF